MSLALAPNRLSELEQTVERGMATFVEVGIALKEIRDSRLYRESGFANFETYCQERWGHTRMWASRTISAADAVVTHGLQAANERQARKLLAAPNKAAPEVPEGTYATIVADPPWQYANTATRGSAEDHYPTMSLGEISNLEVSGWAAPDAHLYLWTTNNFLSDAFDIVKAWGFEYRTLLTWVKPQIGMGNYFRSRTEHVLFCSRGKLGTNRKDVSNVIDAKRTKHSAKPDAFYDMVETMSPPPYLEMFARRRRLGDWSVWGNEA